MDSRYFSDNSLVRKQTKIRKIKLCTLITCYEDFVTVSHNMAATVSLGLTIDNEFTKSVLYIIFSTHIFIQIHCQNSNSLNGMSVTSHRSVTDLLSIVYDRGKEMKS